MERSGWKWMGGDGLMKRGGSRWVDEDEWVDVDWWVDVHEHHEDVVCPSLMVVCP